MYRSKKEEIGGDKWIRSSTRISSPALIHYLNKCIDPLFIVLFAHLICLFGRSFLAVSLLHQYTSATTTTTHIHRTPKHTHSSHSYSPQTHKTTDTFAIVMRFASHLYQLCMQRMRVFVVVLLGERVCAVVA